MNTENHGVSADEKRDLLASRHPEELQHQADAELSPPVIGDDGAEILSNRPRAMTGDEIGEMLDSLVTIAEVCESLGALMPMMLAAAQVGKPAQRGPSPDGSGLVKRRG